MRTTSTGRPPATIRSGVAIREAGNAQIHPQGHWKAVREHQRLCVAAVRGRDGGRAWGRGASRGEFYSSGPPRTVAPSTGTINAVVGSKNLVIAYASSGLLSLLARRWRFRCRSRSRARGTQRKARSCARAARAAMPPLAHPRLGRTDARMTRRQPARHGMTLDKRKRSERKARAGRGHFASSRSPTQSIPTGKCRCSAWRWRPQHAATGCRMSRSRYSRAGTSRPAPAASARAAAR